MSTDENGSANAYGWRWYVGGPIGGPLIALILGGLAGLTPAAYRRGMRTDDLISTVGWPGVSPTYVESMLAVLVTAVGFLIVAVVFTYEQQRRTWRLSLDIGDGYRGWLSFHSIVSLALIGVGTLLGLFSVTGIDEGDLAGRSAIVATALGFAGLAQAAVLLFISVRMLTPERLAERIVRTPRGKRMGNPAQRLMDLAIIEHRADDHIEYQKRLQAIRRLGTRTPDGDEAFAPDALRALLDIAIRIRNDRDPILMALKQSFKVLEHSDEVAQAVARKEPDKVVEKLETILADNLERRHPSATIVKETLRLASSPGLALAEGQVSVLYVEAIRATVFRERPPDLWNGVRASLLDHVAARTADDAGVRVMRWLTEALTDATTALGDQDDVQVGVTRIRELLNRLAEAEEKHPTSAQILEIRLLELLTAPAGHTGLTVGHGSDQLDASTRAMVRSIAQRNTRIRKRETRKRIDARIDALPDPLPTTIQMLEEVIRAKESDNPGARLGSAASRLGNDVGAARVSINIAMDILGDEPPLDGKVAAYLERLLSHNTDLKGLAALPRLIALHQMGKRLQSSSDGAEDTSDDEVGLTMLEADLGRGGPEQYYFSEQLDGCFEDAEQLLLDCRSLLNDPWLGSEPHAISSAATFVRLCLIYSSAAAAHVLREGDDLTAPGDPKATGDERVEEVVLHALSAFARSMSWLLPSKKVREAVARALRASPAISDQLLLDGAVVASATSRVLDRSSASDEPPDALLVLSVISGLRRLLEVAGRPDSKAREPIERALADCARLVDTPSMENHVVQALIRQVYAAESDRDRLDFTSVPDGALRRAAEVLEQRTFSPARVVDLVTWFLDPSPRATSFSDPIAAVLRALRRNGAGKLGPPLQALLADLHLITEAQEWSRPSPNLFEKPKPRRRMDHHALDDLILVERATGWWRLNDKMSASAIVKKIRSERPDLAPLALAIMLRNGNPLRDADLWNEESDREPGPARAATSGRKEVLRHLAAETQSWIAQVEAIPDPTNQQRILLLGLPRTESRTFDIDEHRSQMIAALHAVAHIALVRSRSAARDHLDRFQAWEEDTSASKTVRLSTALAGSLPESRGAPSDQRRGS